MHTPSRFIDVSFVFVLLLSLITGGCAQSPAAPVEPRPLPAERSNLDNGTDRRDTGLVIREAHVLTAMTFPVRVVVLVKGELPDACTEAGAVTQARSGNAVTVTIAEERKSESCEPGAQPFEREIWIDGAFESGDYIVRINGIERRFTV